MKNKYHNYDLHPVKRIEGHDSEIWEKAAAVAGELQRAAEKRKKQGRVLVVFDLYPGVRKEEILSLASKMGADHVLDMEDCRKTEAERLREFGDYITDDRVFGIICHKKLKDFYDGEKLEAMKKKMQTLDGMTVLVGMGAGLIAQGDLYVYCDITRWEIQLRYRAGMGNWNLSNGDAPILTKYKIGFFIEWRLVDRYKKERYETFDYVLETEEKDHPKLVTGEAFRDGLRQFVKGPFRLEPYFDPGVWGGHWMQENFGVGQEKENLAWSFDGVPEENCVNMQFGDITVKTPAMNVTLYCPKELLGERVYGRYGAEFPIRFDFLDTMGGGNLSLQVHPLTEYIQDTFGMHYTQDESYYFLDAEEDTYVYLGLKENVDREKMAEDLKKAEKGEIPFPAEEYVNKIPVKKHDHVLIPAGTIHCSGKNTMVLEISATPYIFTFKLWDWGRVGLDGIPRPVHIEHGLKNIQWERTTPWIEENLIHQDEIVSAKKGCLVEKTGLQVREPIDTFRYSLESPYIVSCGDSVNVGNLVEGKNAYIESTDGSFAPFEVHYAETFIIPADVKEYRIVPGEGPVKVMLAKVRA